MSTDYTIIPVQAGRVLVIIHKKCKISHEETVQLLIESGIDPDKIEFVEFDDLGRLADLDGAPCIIPVDENVIEDQDVQKIAAKCVNSGGAAIVVFGGGVTYSDTHPTTDNYGTQCGWDCGTLNQTLISPLGTQPTGTDKQPTKRTKPKQVAC